MYNNNRIRQESVSSFTLSDSLLGVTIFTNCDRYRTRDFSDITDTRPTTAAAWIDRFLSLAVFHLSRFSFGMLDAYD